MCFRWYLSKSSGWANRGEMDRALDFQVWCGPAIGSFNDFIKGSFMDPKVSGVYHDVYEGNLQILRGAALLRRQEQIASDPAMLEAVAPAAMAVYRPEAFTD